MKFFEQHHPTPSIYEQHMDIYMSLIDKIIAEVIDLVVVLTDKEYARLWQRRASD